MVRETRHLWVGNLPDTIREERVRDHFKRYGRVQSVKLLPGGAGALCATVAFMDIKSAAKAHNAEHTLDEHLLSTEYYEPSALSAAPPPTRFPLGGVPEDHPAFDRSSHFYERGSTTPVSGGSPLSTGGRSEGDSYLRRPPPTTYHVPPESLRGRPRERIYRNGPTYPPAAEKSNSVAHRRTWQFEGSSGRYVAAEPAETSVKCESQSGSLSSRSHSPVRSRSPARSSSASTHSSPSSVRSPSSPIDGKVRLLSSSTATPPAASSGTTPATLSVYSDDRRPLAICVRDLPTRSSDTSLKDGLFHEYKKHGKVTWVKVVGNEKERYAVVCFKKPEDVDKAIQVSQDKCFFGCKIDVGPYHGYDVEDNEARPYDTELDEYHPKATRTLFIGNLEKEVTAQDIRQGFEQFGEILEIDVKKQSGVALSFAFCQFADIASVVQAIRTLDGEVLGESRLKLGFGKSMSSSCVWVAGVADQVSKKYLDLQFRKFGALSDVILDRSRGQALVFFDQLPSAAAAVKEMRGVALHGKRVQVDFASRECQDLFFDRIDIPREPWMEDPARVDASRPTRYETPRVRSSSYSRGSTGGRTPRRHDVFNESPRYRSFEDLSPGSDYEDCGDQSDLNHLHKRRDQIQKLLRLDNRDKEKSRPIRSVTAADQGLVVTALNHRRRLSSHRRSSNEGPAPLCKRRKTGSTSEDERRRHQHMSGDESRPGTPLIDELPDQRPKEPRKGPMKRPDEPLSLPLPEFAAQCFQNIRQPVVSAALSPPRSASPPANPPPMSPVRPPSPLSSSSSEISPQSPTLEERIRSLDEKYEQWSGRTQPVITKPRHHLLEVDVRELQPSDIVKSVLARPSVFDEDSKRLENVNEKYEPKDFSTYQRPPGLEVLTSKLAPNDPRSACYAPVSVRVSPHGSPSRAVLSPAAKGLQYPFPSHPPMLPSSSIGSAADSMSPPCNTQYKMMSKSMEFSVMKAESWLGISRSADSNVHGFTPRFHASGLRHKNEVLPAKVDGKPTDPRLEKSNVGTPHFTPGSATPSTLTTPTLSQQRVVHRLCDGEWSKAERINATSHDLLPVDSMRKLNRVRVDGSEFPQDNLKSMSHACRKLETVPISGVNISESIDVLQNLEGCAKTLVKEIVPKSIQTTIDSSACNTLDIQRVAQESESKELSSDKVESVSVPTKNSESVKLDFVHLSESTKSTEPMLAKPNHQFKSVEVPPSVIQPVLPSLTPAPIELVKPIVSGERKPSLPPAPCSDLKPSSSGPSTQSHIEPVPPKSVSDYVPFNVRDKESGEKVKASLKEKDKIKDDKEKNLHCRDGERDKHKEKVVNDKERHKSIARDKAKDRELPENVDKERKKDRDVEIERRKDRESMEVTEREKRKGSCDTKEEDVEAESKKDHHDTLDRRKGGSDKKALDHHERKSIDHNDKFKRRDEERDRKKENVHERDKKKEHSSDRHRKISEDRKRDDRDKEKWNNSAPMPATIGEKRRSQDIGEGGNDIKRAKHEHKRRDSRDSKGSGVSGSSKRTDPKPHEFKLFENKSSSLKPPTEFQDLKSEPWSPEVKKNDETDKKKHLLDTNEKTRPKDIVKKIKIRYDKDEVCRNLKEISAKCAKDNQERPKDGSSDTDDEKKHFRKDKEKKKMFGSCESLDDKKISKKEKRISTEKKREDEPLADGHEPPRERTREVRKENGINESCTDSDSEPKKHSIFDVVVDNEPAYISMYDKVKARSCKNLQKQAAEKKQTKLKEKFSQLKQSRAKREDKKRSTSWDDDSDSDASLLRRRRKRLNSEDDKSVRHRGMDIYTDDDSDTMDRTKTFTLKAKLILRDDDSPINNRKVLSPKIVSPSNTTKPEKVNTDIKSKARLSLDSSSESIADINKLKKRASNDTLSENEYSSQIIDRTGDKSDKLERRKERKRDKRPKSSEDEKFCEIDQNDFKHNNDRSLFKKIDKKERRKSLQISIETPEDVKPKKKSPKLSAQLEVMPEKEEKKLEDIFGSCEDSDQSQQKADTSTKSVPSKWLVDDIYNSDPDESDVDARKIKEKRKKDKKLKEPSKEVIEAGQAIEQKLGFSRRESSDGVKEDVERSKLNKEKKKKRKKSKDEKTKHHHYHHHHHHEKSGPESTVENPPPLPSLSNLLSPQPRQRSPSPNLSMPVLTKSVKKDTLPLFECTDDEKQHDSAVKSISMPDVPKKKQSPSPRDTSEDRDGNKERTVISQEETEVAVAALLGETFSYGNCYSGSPPTESEPALHDEEEMRQAVQSLNNDVKPSTPQSESDLQIDTDAEESEEFPTARYDFIPRTPDVEAGPPKTPDIAPPFPAQNNKSFTRKDTMHNSRDEMDPTTPVKEADPKPPVLTPLSPKIIKNEPPSIELQKRSPEKVFMESRENRLLSAPPPLVPVSKQVSPSPPRSSSNIAIARPVITLSSPPTLVFTPIRTTQAPTLAPSMARKTYAVAPSGIIPARVALPPPVLSPVTPNTPVSPSPIRTPTSRFVPSSPTIVSPRPLPAHIVTGKIMVAAPRCTAPQPRPILTAESVVKTRTLQPISLPSLTVHEKSPPRVFIPLTSSSPAINPTIVHTSTAGMNSSDRSALDSLSPKLVTQSSPPARPPLAQQLLPAARPVIQVQSPEKSPSLPQQQLSPLPPPLQLSSSPKPPSTPSCPVVAVSQSPLVHHIVPSLVASKPLLTTVNTPVAQFAHKSVLPPTSQSPTIEAHKAEVSVICQKLSAEKSATIRDVDNKSNSDEDKNSDEFNKLISEIQSKAAANAKGDDLEAEKPPTKPEIEKSTEISRPSSTLTTEVKEKPVVEKIEQNSVSVPVKNGLHPVTEVLNTESVIKKLEIPDTDVPQELIKKSSEQPLQNNTDDGSRDESSDDDKPINALARKTRKKATRGGTAATTPRRGGRTTTQKTEVSPTTPSNRRGCRNRGNRGGLDDGKKLSADVYEFHDESDEEKSGECERPRLVITIKNSIMSKETPAISPSSITVAAPKASSLSPKEVLKQAKSPPAPPVVKPKESTPEPQKLSPKESANTRKSRRLLEKDSKSSVDEVIEDVIRNVRNSPRRSTRQGPTAPVKPTMPPPLPKKNLRSKKSASDEEVKIDSCRTPEEENPVIEEEKKDAAPQTLPKPSEEGNEISDEEPTTLIDPVTGMLMVMRAKEGGKYVPVPNAAPVAPPTPPPSVASVSTPPIATPSPQLSPVIATVAMPTKTSPTGTAVPVASQPSAPPEIEPVPSIPEPVARQQLEPAPVVSEGIASHWLTQETKTSKSPAPTITKTDAPGPSFMSCRPPTPPTTPMATSPLTTTVFAPIAAPVTIVKVPETVMRAAPRAVEIQKPMELPVVRLPDAMETLMASKEPNKIRVERVMFPSEYLAVRPTVVKVQPRTKTIVLPPGKQLYSAVRCIQPGAKGPLLQASIAGSPPIHDVHHPLTGAVASPPPRAPHFASQQPIVAGASSSRAFGDSAKGSRGSPRPLTISPYDAALHKSGHSVQSPPPAHQQGDGVTLGHLPFVHHPQFVYQQYLPSGILPGPYRLSTAGLEERGAGDMGQSPPLEMRRPAESMFMNHLGRYYDEPPPAHLHPRPSQPAQKAEAPSQPQPRVQAATPPHASQVPPSQDSLLTQLKNYPIMWQGLLALKNDQSAVQMYFVLGNEDVARASLRCNADGSTSPLRIAQRMRLEQTQLEGVARKMQIDNEHCMLLALPCGRDQVDVLKQSTSLNMAFISYLQQKQAAGIVNIAHPGSTQPAYVVHIFPSCEFANANMARVAPDLVHSMRDIPHLIIVIATV